MNFTDKLQFGFTAVQSGLKSSVVNAIPTLTVNSTEGKFTITAPVSKALNIAVGENVAFSSNAAKVEEAIAAHADAVMNCAAELGVDIDTYEGHQKVLNELTIWAIYKGVAKVTRAGKPIMVVERVTTAEKEKFIAEHKAEIVAANRDELIARVGDENASDEDLAAAITVKDIPSPTVQDYTGSRCATSSNATGVGVTLTFSDTSKWNQMKADLEVKTSVNRVYDVLLENPISVGVNNGKEELVVTGYPIVFREDTKPARIGVKKEENAD